MVELLVTLLLLVIAGAGASLIYDKNKDKFQAKLQSMRESAKSSQLEKYHYEQSSKEKPKRSTPESLYAEFEVKNKNGKHVSLEEFKKLLKQPANVKAVNTALAVKRANDALKKGEISINQAAKNIEDALTKLKK